MYTVTQQIEDKNNAIEKTVLDWAALHAAGNPIRFLDFQKLAPSLQQDILNSVKK